MRIGAGGEFRVMVGLVYSRNIGENRKQAKKSEIISLMSQQKEEQKESTIYSE